MEFGIVAVVLLIVLPFLGKALKRRATSWGEAKGKEFAANQLAKHLPDLLAGIGTPVRFQASSAAALPVVDAALGAKKKFKKTSSNQWSLSFLGEEQFTFALVDTSDGAELQVDSFMERNNTVLAAAEWPLVRKAVLKAAATQGLAVSDAETSVAYARGEQPNADTVIWRKQV